MANATLVRTKYPYTLDVVQSGGAEFPDRAEHQQLLRVREHGVDGADGQAARCRPLDEPGDIDQRFGDFREQLRPYGYRDYDPSCFTRRHG